MIALATPPSRGIHGLVGTRGSLRLETPFQRMAGGGDAISVSANRRQHAGVGAESRWQGSPGGCRGRSDPMSCRQGTSTQLLGGRSGGHHARVNQGARDALEIMANHLAALRSRGRIDAVVAV